MKKVAKIVFNSFQNDSRVLKEAHSLSKEYDVTVIAHRDRGTLDSEKIGHFQVKRFSYLDRKVTKSIMGKLWAYIKFILMSAKFSRNVDIIHCNDLNAMPVAFLVKSFLNRKVKVVYDAHEFETEVAGLSGKRQYLTKITERLLIKYADKVITVSASIADEYSKMYSIDRPALILNTPPLQNIKSEDLFRKKFDISADSTIFLYQGGLWGGRGIEILLEAFEHIEDDSCIAIFMGYGELENEIKHKAELSNNIYFHEAVSPEVLLEYTSSADFGILFYENTCLNHYYCSPNKMFEYLMAGLPVIVSNLYEMRRLTENNEVGVVAEKNTPEGLIEAVKKAASLDRKVLGESIKNVKKIYNWENQEKVLLDLYSDLN